jgi:hypothetical protein
MINILLLSAAALMSIGAGLYAVEVNKPNDEFDHINALRDKGKGSPVRLKGHDSISTRATFQPPVEITIVGKTDSTNLRIGYAANEVIFNWEGNHHELRVDGGPANGQHKPGAGTIPTNKYVTIRWLVTAGKQMIYVNDELRFEHSGDYSKLNNPITVTSSGSEVTVKTIKVKAIKDADLSKGAGAQAAR